LHDAIGHAFEVGIIKAPFMALVIGIVACSEGLRVKGMAESSANRRQLGGEIDLSGACARRAVCDLLRIDRNVTMQEGPCRLRSASKELCGSASCRDRPSVAGRASRRNPRLVGASGRGKSVLMRTSLVLFHGRGRDE